jgi:hypothetical protein
MKFIALSRRYTWLQKFHSVRGPVCAEERLEVRGPARLKLSCVKFK